METPPPGPLRLVADIAVVVGEEVLLVRFAAGNDFGHPEGWLLPGGGLALLEHPDETVGRLLAEQIGLEVDPDEVWLDHVESSKALDGAWLVAFHYLLESDAKPFFSPPEGVTAAWWPLGALPNPSDVAHMGWALTTLDTMLNDEDEEEEEEEEEG